MNKKQVIRINENQLNELIKESINNVLKESYGDSKENYRKSYRMGNFNNNIEGLFEAIRKAKYYSKEIIHSELPTVRSLKKAGFYKSQEKMEEVYKYLQKAERLISLVKQDVSGEYKRFADSDPYIPSDQYERHQEMRSPFGV